MNLIILLPSSEIFRQSFFLEKNDWVLFLPSGSSLSSLSDLICSLVLCTLHVQTNQSSLWPRALRDFPVLPFCPRSLAIKPITARLDFTQSLCPDSTSISATKPPLIFFQNSAVIVLVLAFPFVFLVCCYF